MKEKVYFIQTADNESDAIICGRLEAFLKSRDMLGVVANRDTTAVKTHFGESADLGFVRPVFLKTIGELVKEKGGVPFLTETSTLYKGNRDNAIKHIAHAQAQGFGFASTGMPIIMADGLYGDEEYDVPIKGHHYQTVRIAALAAKCNALVVVTHFTGHIGVGFGGALKNLGMGLSSRKGKLEQHSTAKPKVNKKKCTGCGVCEKWCPADAIAVADDGFAVIDKTKCIGCGQCLAMCRFEAVGFNWAATHENLQQKVVEHAMGVCTLYPGKTLFINFLIRVSKDCDCMVGSYKKIVPDLGILVGTDPVAVDAASLDLVEKQAGASLSQLTYDIPIRVQIDHARDLGFGNPDYELIT